MDSRVKNGTQAHHLPQLPRHGARSVGLCDMIMWNGSYDYVISGSVIISDFMIWLYKVIIEDVFSYGDYRWGWVFLSYLKDIYKTKSLRLSASGG